ncbi:MAG: hypothetical protein RQ745_03220 [Longimicrobiales bacterium]|nr:hypothetical protein [Longimicrobiales bacterium]
MIDPLSLPPDLPLPERRLHLRRRSVGFLERENEQWACFLVTFLDPADRTWKGHFSFRPSGAAAKTSEARTGDIFIESEESEIARKARELGRPLLSGLLESAVHTRARNDDRSPFLKRWFEELLTENATRLAEAGETRVEAQTDLEEIRSLYASYRLDQVCHFIHLVHPDDFEIAVGRILDDIEGIDFAATDRHQLAMLVVEFIERRLPIPDFQTWARDYLAHEDEYRRYAHALHREGILP